MNTHKRRAAVAIAATAMAVSLAACGSAKESGGGSDKESASKKGDDLTIGLLLPENETARYEKFDKPLIEKEISQLTHGKANVIYNNAKQDASLQSQQADTMVTQKVDALIVDAVDSKAIQSSVTKAEEAGIPVVAYDRLAEGPVKGYTSFDNVSVGKAQGEALLKALGNKAKSGKVVMMNGSATDPNAAQFKEGAHDALDGKVSFGPEYDTVDWKADKANANMQAAITKVGKDKIVGVYSANDSMAGGVITALQSAGVKKLPPVTGQDAEIAGVQRIVQGTQYMSVYKSYPKEAEVAGKMAVALAQGKSLDGIATSKEDSATTKQVPSVLVPVVSLTQKNIKETVVADGFYTVKEICTKDYADDCAKIGLN